MNPYDVIGEGADAVGAGIHPGAPPRSAPVAIPAAIQAEQAANARPVFQPSAATASPATMTSAFHPAPEPPSFLHPQHLTRAAQRIYRPRYVVRAVSPSPAMVCGAAYVAWQRYANSDKPNPAKVTLLRQQFERCLQAAVLTPYTLPVAAISQSW